MKQVYERSPYRYQWFADFAQPSCLFLQSMVMSDFGRYSNEFLLNATQRLETIGILDLNNWDFRAEFIAKIIHRISVPSSTIPSILE